MTPGSLDTEVIQRRDIDIEQVAAAAVQARSDYRQYVQAVASALRDRSDDPHDP